MENQRDESCRAGQEVAYHETAMRSEKRLWIYSGFAVPEGVALVRRRPARRSACPRRVLLVGDLRAQALMAPMARLADGDDVALHVDAKAGSTARDWAKNDWLNSHLAIFRPTVVFLAIDPRDMLARRTIRARVRRAGAQEFWLVPAGVPHPPSARFIAAPQANVAGFAAWAGRAWSVIK